MCQRTGAHAHARTIRSSASCVLSSSAVYSRHTRNLVRRLSRSHRHGGTIRRQRDNVNKVTRQSSPQQIDAVLKSQVVCAIAAIRVGAGASFLVNTKNLDDHGARDSLLVVGHWSMANCSGTRARVGLERGCGRSAKVRLSSATSNMRTCGVATSSFFLHVGPRRAHAVR